MSKWKLNLDQVTDICQRYPQGESSVSLARDMSVCEGTIRRQLIQHGIPIRSRSEAARKYVVDCSRFSEISTQEQAYWLGFIAADGCVYHNKLQILLQRGDKKHLTQLLAFLGSNHPVYDVLSGGFIKGGEQCLLHIQSKELVLDLIRHGVHPRKSFTLEWPEFLSRQLLCHYLRGYVDGNGTWMVLVRKSRPRRSFSFSICSNRRFLEGAQAFLMEACDLRQTKFKVVNRHPESTDICALRYDGRYQVGRIFHLLYEGATIWLPRKREKIEPLLG